MTLRERLRTAPILLAPGIYDALTAAMVEAQGFGAAYLSGASIAYTRLGRPDIGLVSMAEVADTLTLIRDRVALPLIVDADTGYGNALNVQRTVRLFERAGASAIQLEDQGFPKRCGHLSDKTVVPMAEMVGKLHAALDARASAETLIIARTDAIAVEGLPSALDRASAYAEAGADMIFVEALRSPEQMREAVAALGGGARSGGVALMANMVEGGMTPISGADLLEEIGFSLVIYPGGTVRALADALRAYYASLHHHGTTLPWRDRMLDLDGLNALIGTPEMLAQGKRYEPGDKG
jgi:2-methylisocitrate lyase-like PEP mutase family enzyme